MLDTLTHERCAEFLEQRFDTRLAQTPLSLLLVSVDVLGSQEPLDGRRRPFSLVFRGPPAPVLAQGTYPLTHAEFGTLEIFLVPVGPHAQGMCYEAVFA